MQTDTVMSSKNDSEITTEQPELEVPQHDPENDPIDTIHIETVAAASRLEDEDRAFFASSK